MKRRLLVLFGLMFAIFACTNECMNEFLNECLTESNLENNSGNNQTDIDNPVKNFTTLQQVVNDTNAGEEIDLSEYKDLTDYSATVNKTLTIKNGSLNNAKLQITGENVKLEKIEKVSVSTSSRLTITNSKLSDLLIGGSGETSRSTPSSSEMTLAMVTVTDSEIENVELNGFNSQLNITDTVTQIDDILISTKAKVILESGSYEGMKDPTVINGGEVARVDMTKKTELSVLSIYSSPQKLEYNIGDKIDLAGLIVMGTYFTDVEIFKSGGWKGESSDTITKWEDEKDYTVSYDFNIPGVSIVTVTSTKYPEIKCNFHVFVKELQNSGTSQPEKEEIKIEDIRVITFGTPKTLYKVGEKLDLSCYQVVGKYNGFEINLPFTSEPANGTPLTEENTQITFSYNGEIVDTQTITVTKLYYTVTFKDGGKEYTLEVADGELLKLPVVDERTGYTFDGWYKDDGTKIEADYKVTEKLTLTASWNNANTTYKVEHYQQNIADNEYTLFETENKTGKTDENTSATAKDYAGFTAKTIEYAKIVADGSTVVGIYYDRKKITLTLNLDGGNGDESITGKYGADVTTPADPTKTGYTFAGWNLELPAAFPAENATYTAKWNVNTYTVKFDANGGNGEMGKQTFTYDVEQALTANTFTRDGYTFAGWAVKADGDVTYANEQKVSNLTAENKATVTLYAVWNENGKVSPVIFSLPDGTALDYGDSVTLSCATEGAKISYTIVDETVEYTDAITITKDVTITAFATKDGLESSDYSSADYTVKTYTVTYKSDYDTAPSDVAGLKKGDTLTAEQLPKLTTAGYTFAGWYNGETKIEAGLTITGDLTLTAKWTANTDTAYKIEHYQQNIDNDEYTLVDTENKTGKTDENTSATAKDYAGFTAKPIEQMKIAADGSTVVKIYYDRKEITLTLNLDGGETEITDKYGAAVTAPTNLTKNGYTFDSWDPALPTTFPAENATYTAKWNANTYTVKFAANVSDNSVTGTMADMSFNYDVPQTLTTNDFTRDGYTFAGWATSADGNVTYADMDKVKNLTAENNTTVTLYAVWEKTPTYSGGIEIEGNKGVTFWLNGEVSTKTIILSESQSVTISVKSGDTPLALTNAPTITVYNHGDVAPSTLSLTQSSEGTYSFTIPETFPKDETYQFVVSCNYESITYTDTFTVKLSQ